MIKSYIDKPLVSFVLRCFENGVYFWDVHVASPVLNMFVYSETIRAEAYACIIGAALDENAKYQSVLKSIKRLRQAEERGAIFLMSEYSDYFYKEMLSIENQRRMALIAWNVADHMRRHNGRPPEKLSLLGDLPKDVQNSQPFGYEHGLLDVPVDCDGNTASRQGFVIYSHDWEGNLPAWNKAPARILILLQ